jgi:drug/metabolite transporter (DMT)-like permease
MVVAPFGWIAPTWGSLSFFFASGAISVGALFCVNRSLKLAPASTVAPYQYSMIIWAVMFGYVVFGDVPSMATLAGAAIIIGAGLYIFLRERDLGRGETVVSPPV